MDQIRRTKTEHLQELYEKDRHYLTKLDDNRQFAAARCAMGDDISMYGRLASSGVESMNRANIIVCEKTAVDILNAAMLVLKLEGERFQWWQKIAQSRDMVSLDKN
jgi:hypothetical protein